jgi:hypothetical protein
MVGKSGGRTSAPGPTERVVDHVRSPKSTPIEGYHEIGYAFCFILHLFKRASPLYVYREGEWLYMYM